MSTYTIYVNIDPTLASLMKQEGYNLCIAKKVNGHYTVVWSGGTFLANNTFQWEESYQLFCSQNFKTGALVTASTVFQDIAYGQTCDLDAGGALGPAYGTVNDSGIFTLNDQYGLINPGVSGKLGGSFAPIFVSPLQVIKGPTQLEPVIEIMGWFSLTFATGDMIMDSSSNPFDVTYTGKTTTRTVAFSADQVWSYPKGAGQATVLPRRSYHPETGFTYEDSDVDPYSFIQGAMKSNFTGSDGVYPSGEWLAECKLSFPTPDAADDARAYLKQKIIYNIHQSVSKKTDELTFNVKLRWACVTFMTEMMAGSTDDEKIQNAFNAELGLLSVAPTSQYLPDDESHILPSPLAFLASGTHLALDREVHSKTAVVGDQYHVGSEHQEWSLVPTHRRGHYIIEASSGGTYLTVHGNPKEGALVIHSHAKTVWKVEHFRGHVRIVLPDTIYCVELGNIEKKKVHKIVLAKQVGGAKDQLWNTLHPFPNNN